MKKNPKKILIILTGGTICSFANDNGEQASNTKKAQTLIVQNFRNGDSRYKGKQNVTFYTKNPLDILSENMTVKHWNTLIRNLKKYDFSRYDGVIILHGTDTLGFTAPLLSILLAGIKIPVFLVSSQLPIYENAANGNENFKTAVEHIINGIKPNVYVAYRNEETANGKAMRTMYLHLAAHLTQCPNHSNNFYSSDMHPLTEGEFYEGKETAQLKMPLLSLEKLENCVLKIDPYVGLDYSRFSLKGVKVVLHHTYHSSTMAVNPEREDKRNIGYTTASVMSLKRRCDNAKQPIELYIEPCNKQETYLYDTTGLVLRQNVGTSWRTTSEMAYAKLLIGASLGYAGEKLQNYIDTEINGEFIR